MAVESVTLVLIMPDQTIALIPNLFYDEQLIVLSLNAPIDSDWVLLKSF